MLFNSPAFLIFFPLVTAGYFLLPARFRNPYLLAASCYFYMSYIPIYILILVYTILVDYVAGLRIESSVGGKRKAWLALSLFANIGALVLFKYATLIAQAWGLFGLAPGFLTRIVLPIGLSFHTFQAMSYTLEVYKGRQAAERNLLTYSLYVMFFPQMVAGPIERPQNLLHQFREDHRFRYDETVKGLRRILLGMFKKVVVADHLTRAVDFVYGNPGDHTGWVLVVATFFFALQIYCDFSGYSDIALGAAQILGFRLMVNFRNPYGADSFSDLWKRWHISLSSWFRDYLYIPLGGSRAGAGILYFNLFITFLLSGIWHGANLTFAVWGVLNGFYLILAVATRPFRYRASHILRLDRFPTLVQAARILTVFGATCFAWVFFRAKTLADASAVLSGLVRPGLPFREQWAGLGWGAFEWAWAVALSTLLLLTQWSLRDQPLEDWLAARPTALRWTLYYALTTAVLYGFAVTDFHPQRFIYFQF